MKKLIQVSLILLVLVSCTSCNLLKDLFTNPFTFKNSSSYTVHVWPNGQAWIEFYLAPGQSFSVENYGDYDSIRYYYSPSEHVYTDSSGYNTVTFYNR